MNYSKWTHAPDRDIEVPAKQAPERLQKYAREYLAHHDPVKFYKSRTYKVNNRFAYYIEATFKSKRFVDFDETGVYYTTGYNPAALGILRDRLKRRGGWKKIHWVFRGRSRSGMSHWFDAYITAGEELYCLTGIILAAGIGSRKKSDNNEFIELGGCGYSKTHSLTSDIHRLLNTGERVDHHVYSEH